MPRKQYSISQYIWWRLFVAIIWYTRTPVRHSSIVRRQHLSHSRLYVAGVCHQLSKPTITYKYPHISMCTFKTATTGLWSSAAFYRSPFPSVNKRETTPFSSRWFPFAGNTFNDRIDFMSMENTFTHTSRRDAVLSPVQI